MIRKKTLAALIVAALVMGSALALAVLARAGTHDEDEEPRRSIRGAGTTMVEGGTGPSSFTPILTKVAFHWSKSAGSFECLALAPSAEAGAPESGNFDTNIMYVTGEIASGEISGRTAVLKGSATVTGAGAGSNRPFMATITRGGPGATLVLEVSGLTFKEILLQGQFSF
jgi:hypothetical protein